MIRFDASAADERLIEQVVKRALRAGLNQHDDRLSLTMDLTAAHANGCPMDWARLLAADDFNFAHDVIGIQRHLDRDDASETAGQLINCFLPRFHARQALPDSLPKIDPPIAPQPMDSEEPFKPTRREIRKVKHWADLCQQYAEIGRPHLAASMSRFAFDAAIAIRKRSGAPA